MYDTFILIKCGPKANLEWMNVILFAESKLNYVALSYPHPQGGRLEGFWGSSAVYVGGSGWRDGAPAAGYMGRRLE